MSKKILLFSIDVTNMPTHKANHMFNNLNHNVINPFMEELNNPDGNEYVSFKTMITDKGQLVDVKVISTDALEEINTGQFAIVKTQAGKFLDL